VRAEQAAEPTQGAAGLLQHVILDRDPLHTGEEDIFSAMQEGATSYLLKDSLFDDLATRIREVHTGEGRLPHAPSPLQTRRQGSHRGLDRRRSSSAHSPPLTEGVGLRGKRRFPAREAPNGFWV
jgi:DNA-binding NarL/FixJ family response regulator